ncbi:MAG: ATP-binding protein [bacterium]|nr:ATP-binding protein [bacterium]
MIGKIINIEEDNVIVKLEIDISKQSNLVNVHVIFESNNEKIVGEIRSISLDTAKIAVVGQITNNIFTPGGLKKPSFSSIVRIINMEELELILGKQTITGNDQITLGYSTIYNNYKINIGINSFFSNHFAILGNTGSGKSFTVSRLIQNIFTSSNYVPINSNIFIFDAYGEYKNAFSRLNEISPMLNTKCYTTDTISPDSEIFKIPLWLLKTDDIALLLEASVPSQLSIIDKALRLVPIIKGNDGESIKHCNDIIARAILDILKSGKDTIKISDQIKAILSTVSTPTLNLDTIIAQPGYNRPLKQCLFVDNNGKMLEMELVTNFMSTYLIDGLVEPVAREDVMYTLKDLEKAMEFALISEGILKSDKVFDYANILSVRLHTLVNSECNTFFEYDRMISRDEYIKSLITTNDGKKAQIINFNINSVNDRMAKSIVKIISKLLFDFSTKNKNRASIPFHIIVEEAHRYVQNDIDAELLGYNIFDRITKEGRKYGILLGLITQRPSELSDTSISQCSNFLILRTLHPKDLRYIKEMVPNMSEEVISMLKTLQPGNAIGFGSAFKVPTNVKIEKPNPEPLSNNCDVVKVWYSNN